MQNTLEVYEAKNDKTRIYNLHNPKHVLAYAARVRFAWPGGYELLVDFPDGTTLCASCIAKRYRCELESLDFADRLYLYTAADIDPDSCYCEHCGRDVSAYVDEDDDEDDNL